MTGPRVTDRAVLRYLQQVHDVDIDAIREAIADACARGVEAEAPSIRLDGVRFINADGSIVTVLPRHVRPHRSFLFPADPGKRS